MGAFKIKKNGVVYENNKMPGAYPAERVTYDNTESGLTANSAQGAIDEVVEIKANKTDLTNISQSGATATQAISSGTYFYLNGVLVRAKTAIASGATFTLNTNYEVVTVGDALYGINNREDISYTTASGYEKLATGQNYCYLKNNEIHLHCNIYKGDGYTAGVYDYPFALPTKAFPKSQIIASCVFFSAGGAAGSQRGVPGYLAIGATGQAIVMPLASGTNVNCAMIDIVYPID